ncbi:MAG: hypothetical protein WBA23_03925 [Tunicatimonas sp.]
MSNVLTLPLRISSRYLLTFKILASAGVALLRQVQFGYYSILRAY